MGLNYFTEMQIFFYTTCSITSEGFKKIIEGISPKSDFYVISKLPEASATINIAPDAVFIKTLGFAQNEILDMNINSKFPYSKIIWIKTEYEKDDQYSFLFTLKVDLSENQQLISDLLLEALNKSGDDLQARLKNCRVLNNIKLHSKLSKSDSEVLRLLIEDKAYGEISIKLDISLRTIQKTGKRLQNHFGLTHKSQFKNLLKA